MPTRIQEGVNSAISTIMGAYESKIRDKQHQDEMQLRRDQMNAAMKASDEMFKLQHAQLDAQQAHQEYVNMGQYQQTGIAPPDTKVIQGLGPTAQVQPTNVQLSPYNPNSPALQPQQMSTSQAPSGPLVASGLENNQLVAPSGRSYEVPPLAQSPEQQLIQRQTQEQQAEKQREFLRTNQARVDAARQDFNDRVALLGMENENMKQRVDQQHKGAMDLEQLRGKFQLQAARIHSANAGLDEYLDPNIQHAGAIGAVSQEDVRAKFGAKQAAIYNKEAATQGYQFLNKDQVGQMGSLVKMAEVIPKIEQLIKMRQLSPYAINNPFSDEGKQFASLRSDIMSEAPTVARALSGFNRFNQTEMNTYIDQMLPKTGIGTSGTPANIEKLNGFIDKLRASHETLTRGVGTKQRDAMNSYLMSVGFPVRPNAKPGEPMTTPTGGGRGRATLTPEETSGGGGRGGGNLINWVRDPKTGTLTISQGGQ